MWSFLQHPQRGLDQVKTGPYFVHAFNIPEWKINQGAQPMKLLFDDLSSYSIQKLIFNSIDQALYQVIVVIDDTEHVVWESEKKTLISRNLMQLREKCEVLKVSEKVLRHESAYDEMIGLASKGVSNRMEVPLANNPYAEPNKSVH